MKILYSLFLAFTWDQNGLDLSLHSSCVVVSFSALGTSTEFSMFYLSQLMSLRCYVLFSKPQGTSRLEKSCGSCLFVCFSPGGVLDTKRYIKERKDR